MWMAELAARSGYSVATVKYYLREGLLHPGEATGATRARYDETHVRRLRLVRALTEVAGLRLETVREVLDDIDGARSWHEAVGSAHTRLPGQPDAERPPSAGSLARVEALLERQQWDMGAGHPQVRRLARALDVLDDVGHAVSDRLLDLYAAALRPLAAYEVTSVHESEADLERSVEAAVIGTLLQEPILLSLRRLAAD
jgi:DNA-binding transcriptional MerR regulator